MGASLMHNRKRCPRAFPSMYMHAPRAEKKHHKNQVRHTAELEWEVSMTDRSEQMLYVWTSSVYIGVSLGAKTLTGLSIYGSRTLLPCCRPALCC